MANVVLSLQERCLLYLITHVEDYSPQTLALLPRHLRRALLSSVPPLHLYQLDQTEVASGIDTEPLWDGVWNAILKSPRDSSGVAGSRQLFADQMFKIVASALAHLRQPAYGVHYSMRIDMTLFGLLEPLLSSGIVEHLKRSKSPFMYFKDHHCFVNFDVEKYKECLLHECQPHSALRPPRSELHAFIQERIYSCNCVIPRKFLVFIATRFVSSMARAGFTPTKLNMNVYAMANAELWQPGKGGLLQPFLDGSKLERVELRINPSEEEPPNITQSILCTVLSSPQLCLQTLSVTPPLDGDSLASIAPSLAAYGQLKYLTLVIDVCKASKSHYAGPLHSIIANQRAIECVELEDISTCKLSCFSTKYNFSEFCDENILASLGNLFLNDDFHKLTIIGFTIPLEAFQTIVAAFFKSSPNSQQCHLFFSLTRFQKSSVQPDAISHPVDITREHAEKFARKKRLRFESTQFVGDPTHFWRWFDSVPYIYLLELRARCECHGKYMRSHFKDHPNFKVEHCIRALQRSP